MESAGFAASLLSNNIHILLVWQRFHLIRAWEQSCLLIENTVVSEWELKSFHCKDFNFERSFWNEFDAMKTMMETSTNRTKHAPIYTIVQRINIRGKNPTCISAVVKRIERIIRSYRYRIPLILISKTLSCSTYIKTIFLD